METGEAPEEALKCEILEEMDTRIKEERFVQTVEWDYTNFLLTMCYLQSVLARIKVFISTKVP